jgi:ribonucleoside-diphosphate reductase beta chain
MRPHGTEVDPLADWEAPVDAGPDANPDAGPDANPGADRSGRLYLRWEEQPWSALSVDLSVDKATWPRIPEQVRSEIAAAVSELGRGEVAVLRGLTSLIDHAPKESWRIYLATQFSDEARHTVFFRRYTNEVFEGREPDPQHAELIDFVDSAYTTEFEPGLFDTLAGVEAEPDNLETWYRAITLYHLVTEGVLGVTVLRLGQALSANRRMCPGLAEGVASVFRDESRHIGFGRAAAAEGLANGHGAAIADSYRLGVELAARVMVGPTREQHDLDNPRWREQRGEVKRARLADASRRAADQAARLHIPISREELERAWATARDQAFRDYRDRWSRPHAADTALKETA